MARTEQQTVVGDKKTACRRLGTEPATPPFFSPFAEEERLSQIERKRTSSCIKGTLKLMPTAGL